MYAQPHACSWNLSFNPLLFKSSRWVVKFPFVVSTEFFLEVIRVTKNIHINTKRQKQHKCKSGSSEYQFYNWYLQLKCVKYSSNQIMPSFFWQEKTNTPTLLWTAGTKTRWLLVTLPNSPILQFYKWKLSPHPQTPLMLGLLNTNSLVSLSST